MGIYEDIEEISKYCTESSVTEINETAARVLDWLQSPSCPLNEEEEED